MQLNLTIALVLTIAIAASAQDNPGQGRGGRGGRGGPNAGFTILDTNSDGTLDAAEIDAAPKSLAKLDKNADGQIVSDEVRAAMPQGRGRGGPDGGRGPEGGRGRGGEDDAGPSIVEETVKTLMAFDSNGDGKLSKAELPDRYQGLFARGDENKDGFLTPDEIRKMTAAQAPPPDAGGRGEGGGRGRGGEGRGGEGRGGEGRGGDMNFIRMDPVLAAIDTNGDGILSAEEIRNAAASVRKLDKDGDGKVTRQEASPAGRGQ